jgi:hypothetical protein
MFNDMFAQGHYLASLGEAMVSCVHSINKTENSQWKTTLVPSPYSTQTEKYSPSSFFIVSKRNWKTTSISAGDGDHY